ncbi:MAG: hypothetical protein AAF514_17580 [Verrucomicrobiota bacterium]
MSSIFQGSRSSVIDMTLSANGETFKVTHSYPDHLLLVEPASVQPCDARLTVSIDGDITEIPFEIRSAVSGRRIDADFSPQSVPFG